MAITKLKGRLTISKVNTTDDKYPIRISLIDDNETWARATVFTYVNDEKYKELAEFLGA